MSKPSSTNSPRLSISERKDWYISRVSRDTDIAKVTDKVALSRSNILKGIKVVIALGIHLFPFRTEKLSPTTSMVLRKSGRVDSRRFLGVRAKVLREGSRFSFESAFFVSDSPFFRDRVLGWRVCPPRRYVRFACNARIVMSQDPADARMGGINDPTVQWRKPDLDQNSTLGV